MTRATKLKLVGVTIAVGLLVACGSSGHAKATSSQWQKDKRYLQTYFIYQLHSQEPDYPLLTNMQCVHQSGRSFICIADTTNGGDSLSLDVVCDGLGRHVACAVSQKP